VRVRAPRPARQVAPAGRPQRACCVFPAAHEERVGVIVLHVKEATAVSPHRTVLPDAHGERNKKRWCTVYGRQGPDVGVQWQSPVVEYPVLPVPKPVGCLKVVGVTYAAPCARVAGNNFARCCVQGPVCNGL